jgi:hypothetical protein
MGRGGATRITTSWPNALNVIKPAKTNPINRFFSTNSVSLSANPETIGKFPDPVRRLGATVKIVWKARKLKAAVGYS